MTAKKQKKEKSSKKEKKISKTTDEIKKFIDDIAAEIIICDTGDLAALGEVSNRIDSFKEICKKKKASRLEEIINDCSSLADIVFLNPDDEESENILDLLREAFSILQKNIKNLDDKGITKCKDISSWQETADKKLGRVGSKDTGSDDANADEIDLENEDLINEFAENIPSALDFIEQQILKMENKEGNEKDEREALLRKIHTLKGEAGFLKLSSISKLFHQMEATLEEPLLCKKKGFTDLFLSTVDFIREHQQSGNAGSCDYSVKTQLILNFITGKDQDIKSESSSASGEYRQDAKQIDETVFFDFISESQEHIQTCELGLIEIEKNPNDMEILNSLFRSFHTIKGVSSFLELNSIRDLTHAAETLLDDIRKGDRQMDEGIVDALFDSIDILKRLVENPKIITTGEGGSEFQADYDRVLQLLNDIKEGKKISSTGNVGASKGKMIGEILVEKGAVSKTTVKKALEQQQEHPDKKLGEILIEEKDVPARMVAEAIREQKTSPMSEKTSTATVQTDFVKISTEKLDHLINMVGELVINETQIEHSDVIQRSDDDVLLRTIRQISKVVKEIQSISMGMRMIPVKQTFQKMERVVRDIARKSDKKIRLDLLGEDTELDRNVIEKLYDPLIHMIRNSCDHGVETPDARIKKGKSDVGNVVLNAYHQGGSVVIEIKDDGNGLDRDAILEKAISKGLAEKNKTYTDSEVFNFIFAPGFSTAKQVTSVSGRGVGMDVVKKNIDLMRGKVEITSEKDKGSVFYLKIPLTLAIIEGMVVEVGKERYIFPTISVKKFINYIEKDITHIPGQGDFVNDRGDLIPLYDLRKILQNNNENSNGATKSVLIIDADGKEIGFITDELLGQFQIVIKTLGDTMKNLEGISGGAILGDGTVGLIVDPTGMKKYCEEIGSNNCNKEVKKRITEKLNEVKNNLKEA